MDFVHLHLHTEYSLLDSMIKIEALTDIVKAQGMKAVAITDHGNMFGAYKFYKAMKSVSVKPIIGCEIYMKNETGSSKRNTHLTLLVKDAEGYTNLSKLLTTAFLNSKGMGKPHITKETLFNNCKGLICLSGCLSGEIPQLILQRDEEKVIKTIMEYKDAFGKENFYLELQDEGLKEQKMVSSKLIELSKKLNIPCVATNDVHYLKREDAPVHEVLVQVGRGGKGFKPGVYSYGSDQYYFRSAKEMYTLFKDVPESLTNTMKIAEMCNFDFDSTHSHMPLFPLPDGKSSTEVLRREVWKGVHKRYPENRKDVKERVEYELKVICDMGYADYFLIVADMVNYAKTHNILTGPGRGSATGSIVAYALGITDVDPLRYNLIFERFLNRERVSMPDIDIDIEDVKRQEIIRYIRQRYGEENVAQIITFGTMASRAVIRDVGRVLGVDYALVDRIAKAIPFRSSLNDSLKIDGVRRAYDSNELVRKMIDYSLRLEGLPRHVSVHAAGIVIGDKPLVNYFPLAKSGDDVVTQFPMDDLEEIGMLKMDFLGLRTLTVIHETLMYLNKDITYLYSIPLDDSKTFDMISKGDTVGVFQLESEGMKKILRRMSPHSMEDIIAALSLHRPGPMESGAVETYINRKAGRESIRYVHPSLEPVLKETYGVMVYQEQVMQVANRLANYSLGEADILRRAMAKKKVKEMADQHNKFIDGCVKNGIDRDVAEMVFEQISAFAGYGFNKCHGAGYAHITYWESYLKAHYPLEFMSSLLTSVMGNMDKLRIYIREVEKMGFHVLPPDVNVSEGRFIPEKDNGIRFGLLGIKGVGENLISKIVSERKKEKFKDVVDLFIRIGDHSLNQRSIESLIWAGAFDSLMPNRKAMITFVPDLLQLARSKQRTSQQPSLFGSSGEKDKLLEKIKSYDEFFDKDYEERKEREHIGIVFQREKEGVERTEGLTFKCSTFEEVKAIAERIRRDPNGRRVRIIFEGYILTLPFRYKISK